VRRFIGGLAQLLVLVFGATILGRAGVALGTTRGVGRAAFLPFPVAAAQRSDERPGIDSARVARVLQAARGTNTLACELAAATVDGRSGWSSGTDGDFRAGGSDETTARDIVTVLHHEPVDRTAVPLLRASLADADWCVRRLAAPLLGRARDPSAMQAMLAALAAADPVTREMAALALGFASDSASVGPLVARLRDDAPRVRATAAWALGEIEHRTAVRPLIDALADSDALVRESVAHALGEIEDTTAIPALADRLKSDQAAAVRRAAARALGEIAG
jgi:hypothetical protein